MTKEELIAEYPERAAQIEEAFKPENIAKARGVTFGSMMPEDPKQKKLDALAELEKEYPQYAHIVAEARGDLVDTTEEFRAVVSKPAEMLTLGIAGDELRAAGRATVAVAADALTGNDYAGSWMEEFDTALEDERKVEENFERDHPVTDVLLDIAFSLPTGMAISKAAGVGASAASGAARQAGAAGTELGIYGFMEGEGLKDRLNDAMVLGGLGVVTGGVVGGIGGRMVGREKIEREILEGQRKAMEAEQARLATGKAVGDLSDLHAQARELMKQKAARHFQLNQTPLEGLDKGLAYKEVAEELGVPIRRIRAAELSGGGTIDDFTEKELRDLIDVDAKKWVPEEVSRKRLPWYKEFYMSGMRPLTKKATMLVGEEFGGKVQRLATKMARSGDDVTRLFHATPVQAFQKFLHQSDNMNALRTDLLNMGNVRLKDEVRQAAYQKVVARLSKDPEALRGFQILRRSLVEQQQQSIKTVNSLMKVDELYWPSQLKVDRRAVRGFNNKQLAAEQQSYKEVKRGFLKQDEAALYETPDVVLDDWLRLQRNVAMMHDEFNLPNLGALRRAEKLARTGKELTKKQIKAVQREQGAGVRSFKEIIEQIKRQGGDEGTAEVGAEIIHSLVVNGSKGPNAVIANFRKAAYMGTIGNPYSAILNIGDVFNSMVNFGADNTVNALISGFKRQGLEIGVDDIGLMHQTTGEFIRDGVGKWQNRFNKLSDDTFKLTGFTTVDRFGKNVATNAALRNNRRLAAQGFGPFRERWGFAFSEPELRQLHKDILRGDKTDLVSELAAAELSKMQPTDLASLPQWFLDNPNWRVLYMLRTFGLKQLQQMENLIVDQWKRGNKKESVKNALAYIAVVGGGNAMVNEGRQVLKGDEPTLSGFGMKYADHMLGAVSANTLSMYGLSRSAQDGDPKHVVSGALPPLGLAVAPLVDAVQLMGADSIDAKAAVEDSAMFEFLPMGRLVQSWLRNSDDD